MRFLALLVVFAALAAPQGTSPEQQFQEAVAAQQRGDYAAAVERYRLLLERFPNHAVVRGNLGAALAALGRFDEAIAEYRIALESDPAPTAVRLNLALALYKTGAIRDAAAEFETLRQSGPADARVPVLLADCYVRLDRAAEALPLIAPAYQANPESADIALIYGNALINSGRPREGIELAERSAKLGNNAEAWIVAGTAARQLGDFTRARDDFRNAVQLNPKLARAHTLAGTALADLGEDDAALAAFREALALAPADFEANLQAGALYYRRRDLPAARRHLEHALKAQPGAAAALYQLALVKSAEGKTAEAVADFERLTRESPDWLEPHVQLSRLYYKVNRPDDGVRERATADRLRAEAQRRTGGIAAVP